MIDSKSAGRYLLYSIGEIVLVVLGILIALQINNWNETRKSRILEKEILVDLYSTLKGDYKMVKKATNGNRESKLSCEIILFHFDNNLPFHDSLAVHFENAHLWWKTTSTLSAYERAKSYGLDFIEADSIRHLISTVYVNNWGFAQTLDEREALYYYNIAGPILTNLFESTEIALAKSLIAGNNLPHNYQQLKNNINYRTVLKTSIGNRNKTLKWQEVMISNMVALEKSLEKLLNEYPDLK